MGRSMGNQTAGSQQQCCSEAEEGGRDEGTCAADKGEEGQVRTRPDIERK